ncbi:hypothetical protein H8U31_001338 [Salmonella enterica]|nr:hypothetical protein [Salmonella enterica]
MDKKMLLNPAYFRPAPAEVVQENLFKSRPEGGEEFIWTPHESSLIRKMIELFTQRGLMRLESVRKALMSWQNFTPSPFVLPSPKPAIAMMARWTPEERSLVQIYLESLPPAAWTLDDHMLSVELVVQNFLPKDELVTEATWLATKATMMGKVESNWLKTQEPTQKEAAVLLARMPANPEEAAYFPMAPKERTTLEFANFRAVESVVNLSDNVRKTMRNVVARQVEKKMQGDTSGPSLEQELFDSFGEFNRDWRRIAVTEAGEAQLQGMIAGCKPGDKVKRVEQYANACQFCKKIDGVIATIVDADHPDKDPETMIWPGKNNIGRSAHPHKRVGNQFVKRSPDEMYWLPAGLAHPHCRGRWVPVVVPETPQDPEFAALVAEFLANT